MNRRGFLKCLALAPAVAAVPSLAMAAVQTEAKTTLIDSMAFFYRPDLGRWMGYAVSGNIMLYGQQYEFASLFDAEPPTEKQRKMFAEMAEIGFERAKRKHG